MSPFLLALTSMRPPNSPGTVKLQAMCTRTLPPLGLTASGRRSCMRVSERTQVAGRRCPLPSSTSTEAMWKPLVNSVGNWPVKAPRASVR
jgi:hypothetical protein